MAGKKPEGFVTERPFAPCAGNPACRFPGRVWVSYLQHNERLCIHHYYLALDERPEIRGDDTTPPKEGRMPGVRAKAVAGE